MLQLHSSLNEFLTLDLHCFASVPFALLCFSKKKNLLLDTDIGFHHAQNLNYRNKGFYNSKPQKIFPVTILQTKLHILVLEELGKKNTQ